MPKYIVIFFLLLFSIEIAQAGVEPGEQFTEIIGVRLGQQLEEIQNKFGKTMIRKSGDASTGQSIICYRIQNSPTVIEFSRGELHYSYMLRKAERKDQNNCSLIKKELLLSGELQTGLRLDMSLQEFKKLLGPSVKSNGSVVEKHFVWKKAMTAQEAELQGHYLHDKTYFWNVLVFVKGTFNEDVLINLRVSKSEQE